MPASSPFDYAIIRVVPRVERGEFLNAGVIVHCPTLDYLAAAVSLDARKLKAWWPDVDATELNEHLEVLPRIAAGERTAGPIASLSRSERFHWLVAPRSTVVQVSSVHSGICEGTAPLLEQLMNRFVR